MAWNHEVTEEYWGYGVGLAVGFLFGLLFNWLTTLETKTQSVIRGDTYFPRRF